MLRAAGRAKTSLGNATGLVAAFVRTQADPGSPGRRRGKPGGGFRDRSGKPDLYYTVFGLQCLLALGEDVPAATEGYLRSLADPRTLDFIHAACLARCWALVRPEGAPAEVRGAIVERLQAFRSADGGFGIFTGADTGAAYGAFLALGALEDLGAEVPEPGALATSVQSLRMPDGGCTNDFLLPLSSTPAAAACVAVLSALGRPLAPEMISYLLARVDPSGGLLATAGAPVADLLSTATGLHALWRAGVSLDETSRLTCAGFVASLVTESGGFRGHAADNAADCEYTFYGLMALGHLAGKR